jgi:hypothetical protein
MILGPWGIRNKSYCGESKPFQWFKDHEYYIYLTICVILVLLALMEGQEHEGQEHA